MILVACTAIWMLWLLWDSYFYVDDFLRLGEASRVRLDWSYLSDSVFGHFVPGWRLTYFVLARKADFHYWPVILLEVLLQCGIVVGLYRLFRALFGPRRWIPWVVGLYPLSPAMMETVFWFANALHVLPSLCATIWSLDGFVRWYRRRRIHHLVYSVVVGASGLMFYEKPVLLLFVIPLLVVVISLERSPGIVGLLEAGRELIRIVPVWALYAVPQAVYFGYFFTHHYYASNTKPSLGSLLSTTWRAWERGIGPTFVGGPFHWKQGIPGLGLSNAPGWAVVLGMVVLLVAIVYSVARDRRAWLGWAFAAAGFVASFDVVAWGRLRELGPAIALDFRYTADSLPLVLIGVTLAFNRLEPGRLSPGSGSTAAHPVPRRLRIGSQPLSLASLALVLPVALVASSLVSVTRYRTSWNRAVPKEWTKNFIAGLRQLEGAHRPFSVLDGQVPAEIALLGGYPENLASWQSYAMAHDVSFDDTSKPLFYVGDDGRLVPGAFGAMSSVRGAQLAEPGTTAEPDGSVCVPGGTTVLSAPMPPLGVNVYTMAITYRADVRSQINVQLETTKGEIFGTLAPGGIPLPPTVHQALATLVPADLRAIKMTILAPKPICIDSVALGLPVPAR